MHFYNHKVPFVEIVITYSAADNIVVQFPSLSGPRKHSATGQPIILITAWEIGLGWELTTQRGCDVV